MGPVVVQKGSAGIDVTVCIINEMPSLQQTIDIWRNVQQFTVGKMEDIIKVVQIKNKGRMLNTLENYHIYKETVAGNQINDKQTSKSNKIFETALKHDPKNDNTAPVRRTPP